MTWPLLNWSQCRAEISSRQGLANLCSFQLVAWVPIPKTTLASHLTVGPSIANKHYSCSLDIAECPTCPIWELLPSWHVFLSAPMEVPCGGSAVLFTLLDKTSKPSIKLYEQVFLYRVTSQYIVFVCFWDVVSLCSVPYFYCCCCCF